MVEFIIIEIEWNVYNGWLFSLLRVDDRALFGINASSKFLIIDLFFIHIVIIPD